MSKMPSTGNPHRCPQCRRWFVPTVGMENISCTVMHGGSCCHYSETEVPAPNLTPPSGAQAPALPVDAITGTVVAYLWQVRKGDCVALSVTGDPPGLEPFAMIGPGGDWDEINLIYEDGPPYPPEPTPGLWRLEMDYRPANSEDERRDELCCVYVGPYRWTHVDVTALQQAVADAQKDKVALLRFAGKALYENRMLSIGDWDGGDLQDTAIECGLLEPFDVEGLCGEECRCAEVGFPATCYRFTPLANEAIDAARTPDPAREEQADA